MIVLLSPTKQMDFSSVTIVNPEGKKPQFGYEAGVLNGLLKNYDKPGLELLMKISPTLAEQTYENICRFGSHETPSRAAMFAYSGTVFHALAPGTLSKTELGFADDNLRILSGMYGILEPQSLINPYRLEMKLPIKLPGGESLLSFWRSRISSWMNAELSHRQQQNTVLNLASGEYAKVIDRKNLNGRFLSIHFKEKDGDRLQTVGMYAKTARGLMARRILSRQITDPEILQKGSTGGYRFAGKLSTETDWIFIRNKSAVS